ncbi:MAG: exosortase system-associated protein, TIGR04073 family [Candidatus Omnitrophica bacterium]|nr:exosortase system-associated protein, TIGR04073 family [Candidatus Omnitrophota bacterium]
MKRSIFLFLIVFTFVSGTAWADAATKLSRGISNIAFGWYEVINEVGSETDQHGLVIGPVSGLLRGLFFGVVRTGAGVYEVVTFPFPNWKRGYDPVVLPESAFMRNVESPSSKSGPTL